MPLVEPTKEVIELVYGPLDGFQSVVTRHPKTYEKLLVGVGLAIYQRTDRTYQGRTVFEFVKCQKPEYRGQ